MSNALMKPGPGTASTVRGVVPAVASAIVPGLGQLLNGEGSKALGVFVVYVVAGASVIGWIPIVGTLAGAVGAVTWVYGVVDGFVTGKKKR